MRIAYTTGLLRVPPTYFVVQHGELLIERGADEAAVFALTTDITDAGLTIDVTAAVSEAYGTFGTRQFAALGAAARQARQIAAYDPDVVHQHFATWAQGALAGARRAGAPTVVTLHGYDVFAAASTSPRPVAVFHRRSTAAVQSQATRLLAVSQYLADRAVESGFPAEKLHVHYQGVDTDFFTPLRSSESTSIGPIPTGSAATDPIATRQASAGPVPTGPSAPRPSSTGPILTSRASSSEPPTVVFVGALEPRKGILDLVQASCELALRHEHRLIVVGEGRQRAQVDAASFDFDHIAATGPLGREQIRALLRSARLFVLPTQRDGDWQEAAGLVLLEAQACGVPVVTYDSGGAPEMVDHETTGIVVPEGDIAALMSAMDGVLSLSEREWRALSSRARKWVVAERSLSRSVDELVEHYGELT